MPVSRVGFDDPEEPVAPGPAPAQSPVAKNPATRSQTLERALDSLAILADKRPRTSQQLAVELGLNRSSVYRFLRTLEDYNFVARTADGRYTLGLGIAPLAGSAASPVGTHIQETLDEVANATSATALFCVAQKDHSVVLASARPAARPAAVAVRSGTRFALDSGAPGMAILSLSDVREHEQDEISLARTIGHVHTKGAPFAGFECLAIPVRLSDGQPASLAVVAPVGELRLPPMVTALRRGAARIARADEGWEV